MYKLSGAGAGRSDRASSEQRAKKRMSNITFGAIRILAKLPVLSTAAQFKVSGRKIDPASYVEVEKRPVDLP
ncbi:hypothetical protein MJ391_03165 [Escherichia coli]|nr:hypothetical protein MJ391_03165 [Escherichia coli]